MACFFTSIRCFSVRRDILLVMMFSFSLLFVSCVPAKMMKESAKNFNNGDEVSDHRLQLLWTNTTTAYINSPYLCADGSFILMEMLGLCATMVRVNATTGAELWSVPLPILGTACLPNNNLIPPFASTEKLVFISPYSNGGVYAHDLQTGNLVWKNASIAAETVHFNASADLLTVVVNTGGQSVVGIVLLQASTGKPIAPPANLWYHHLPHNFEKRGWSWTLPRYYLFPGYGLVGAVAYTTYDDSAYVWGFRPETGETLYNTCILYLSADEMSEVYLYHSTLLVPLTGRRNSSVVALDIGSGNMHWWAPMYGNYFTAGPSLMTNVDPHSGDIFGFIGAKLWKVGFVSHQLEWSYPSSSLSRLSSNSNKKKNKKKAKGRSSYSEDQDDVGDAVEMGCGQPLFDFERQSFYLGMVKKTFKKVNDTSKKTSKTVTTLRLFFCEVSTVYGVERWCEDITDWPGLEGCNYTCDPAQPVFLPPSSSSRQSSSNKNGETNPVVALNVFTEIEYVGQSQTFEFQINHRGWTDKPLPLTTAPPLSTCAMYDQRVCSDYNCLWCESLGSCVRVDGYCPTQKPAFL